MLKSIGRTKRTVEAVMGQLYNDYPLKKIPVSIALTDEKHGLEETAFFLSFLCDEKVDLFLDEIQEKWNAWQVTLLKYGMVRFVSPQTLEMADTIKPYEFDPATKEKIEAVLLNVRQPSASHLINKSYGQWDLARNIVADSVLPDLSKSWESFRTYLNDCVNRLADLSEGENVRKDGDLKRLQDTATIVMFEQIRLALWICDNIWSRIDNYVKPKSLKPLRAYSIKTETEGGQNNGAVVRQSLAQQDHLIYF
jgi:hypothetical protein